MNKFYLGAILMSMAMPMFSQEPDVTIPASQQSSGVVEDIEVEEVEIEGETIDDIIQTQGQITANVSTEKHYQSIWSRKGYLNISFNFAKLNPKETYITEVNQPIEHFTSNWGLGIQYGRNYSVLKNPIHNMFMINVDFTPLDLNINHYAKGKSQYLFDSSAKSKDGDYYLPWNTEKVEYNYGINVGPSFTVAPLVNSNNPELHFIKFNVYYHIGYHVSLLQYIPEAENDKNPATFDNINDALKLSFGHGLTNAVGFNVSWKNIGLGYEARWASLSYQSLDKENFGKTKYKFNAPTSRIFIEVRL